MHGKTVVLPPGTTFEGRIDSSVGSRISHPGERFTITMATPVLANGVDVIIPTGAQVIGEVVEAIPASKLPHKKGMPKPTGKLRVQLSSLITPDGVTYPLVASMAGETMQMGRKTVANPSIGGSVGYMGTAAGFEAVAPGMSDRYRGQPGRAPHVMTKQQMLKDAIYGTGNVNPMERMAKPLVRSLVKRDHDLFIDSGSPITIRLDAPFKIGINPIDPGAAVGAPEYEPAPAFPGEEGGSTAGRRFGSGSQPPAAGGPSAFPGDTAGGAPAGGPPLTTPGGSQPPAPQTAPVEQPPTQDTSF